MGSSPLVSTNGRLPFPTIGVRQSKTDVHYRMMEFGYDGHTPPNADIDFDTTGIEEVSVFCLLQNSFNDTIQIIWLGEIRMTEVVAALIWDEKHEKILICQRPPHKSCGLLWEFVGGKVEPGESHRDALIRECYEEIAITLSVGEVFTEVVHQYPDITVHLTLFYATIADGVPQMLEHNDLCWITPKEISKFEFCPADQEILEKIQRMF